LKNHNLHKIFYTILTGGNSTIKNKMIIKIIVSILLAYLMIFIINSLLGITYLAQPELNHIIVLDYILACCIVIIALIIIFGFLILTKHE